MSYIYKKNLFKFVILLTYFHNFSKSILRLFSIIFHERQLLRFISGQFYKSWVSMYSFRLDSVDESREEGKNSTFFPHVFFANIS